MVGQKRVVYQGSYARRVRTAYEVLVYSEQTDFLCFQSSQQLGGCESYLHSCLVNYFLVYFLSNCS